MPYRLYLTIERNLQRGSRCPAAHGAVAADFELAVTLCDNASSAHEGGISDGEQDINTKVNPMEKVFPKVTKCIYKRFGPTASIETNDALCTVPLNILNEKIFVILWFVYWALRILMTVGVTHRILMLFRPFRWVYYSLDLNVKFSTIRHLDRRKIFVKAVEGLGTI